MRKLFFLFAIALVAFMANFSLWFLHTRTINKAVTAYQKELRFHDIYLAYEDIRFSNFKSWRVDGVLEKVTVTFGKIAPIVLTLDELKFKSLPFENTLSISTDSILRAKKFATSSAVTHDFSFIQGDSKMKLAMSLNRSLGNIAELMKNPFDQKSDSIDKLDYTDGGFQVMDNLKSAKYMSTDGTTFNFKSDENSQEKTSDFYLELLGVAANPEYPADEEEKEAHDLHAKAGKMNLYLEVVRKDKPSKLQLEMLDKMDDKSSAPKKKFDSYQIYIKKMEQKNDSYSFMLSGMLDRQPNYLFAETDLDVHVDNYKSLLNMLMTRYNKEIKVAKKTNPEFAKLLYDIDDKRRTQFMKLFADLGAKDDALDMKVVGNSSGDIKINNMPWFELMAKVINIFTQHQEK